MKVLIATDGSKHAMVALESFLARIAWFREPPVIELVHVHLPIPYGRAAAWAGKEAVDRYYSEESDEALKPAAEILGKRGIAFRPVKLVGEPGHEIVGHASASGCDLIAMGTHGHTAMANLVMGSVATKVIAGSKVPVLLLR
jgi:nucleotide-binding universal stress UspA family protein